MYYFLVAVIKEMLQKNMMLLPIDSKIAILDVNQPFLKSQNLWDNQV